MEESARVEPAAPAGDLAPPDHASTDHDCQVPREDPPEIGGTWRCPECGTTWRLELAEEHPEHLPEERDQRINWVRVDAGSGPSEA